MLHRTYVFPSGGICVSGGVLRCVPGVKHRRTIFLARVGLVQIPQKCVGTPDAKFVFYHPVVSAGHVLHSSASGVRNIDVLLFMLGWDCCSFHKKHVRTSYVELVLLHPVEYAGHVLHYGASVV
jgi:hypothetical protein